MITKNLQNLGLQPRITKSFFSITRTIFSDTRSEQFWKQNTNIVFFTEPRDPRPPKPKKHSLRKFSDLEIINQSEGQASTFNNQIEKDYLEVESNQWSGSLPSFDEKSMPSR